MINAVNYFKKSLLNTNLVWGTVRNTIKTHYDPSPRFRSFLHSFPSHVISTVLISPSILAMRKQVQSRGAGSQQQPCLLSVCL